MLKTIEIFYQTQKEKIYQENFDQNLDLWITSDLSTKTMIEKFNLKKHGYFLDYSHMRIQEFWNELFLIIKNPEETIIEKDFLNHYIQEYFIDSASEDSLFKSQDAIFFTNIMIYFSSLIFEEENHPNLLNFFISQHNHKKLVDLYYLSFQLGQSFMKNKKWILPEWIPFLIYKRIQKNNINLQRRNIYVDLGLYLKSIESDIFKELAKDNQIIILEPMFSNISYKKSLFFKKSYQKFNFSKPTDSLNSTSSLNLNDSLKTSKNLSSFNQSIIKAHVFPTEIAQIKYFFTKTKDYLNQGYKPDEIFWFFPNPNELYPLFKILSKYYEIPLNLIKKFSLNSHPAIKKWLEKINIFIKKSEFNLWEFEDSLFIQKNSYKKKIYHSATHFNELLQEDYIALSKNWNKFSNQLTLNDFLKIIYTQWPDHKQLDIFEKIMSTFLNIAPQNEQLSYHSWTKILEKIITITEIKDYDFLSNDQSSLSCVQILKLTDFGFVTPKISFLGSLTQKNILENNLKIYIDIDQIEALNKEFGYDLEHPDYNTLESECYWKAQQPFEILHLSSFHFNILGEPQSVHPIVLERLKQDNLPSNLISTIPNKKIELEKIENIDQWSMSLPVKMPVTQIEKLIQCGFRYFIENNLKIEPPSFRSFDIDFALEGSLYHKLSEYILKHWDKLNNIKDFDDEKNYVDNYVRIIIENNQHKIPHFLIEKITKNLLNYGLNFIDVTRNFKNKCPHVAPILFEHNISIYADLKEKKFLKNPPEHNYYVEITGKIDRVDLIQDYFVIIDYKRSFKSEFDIKNWGSEKYYQMFLYGISLVLNPPDLLINKKWGGCEIFNYRTFERDKGFLLTELINVNYIDKARPAHLKLDEKSFSNF